VSSESADRGFAQDRSTATYYEQRAAEYDDWYTGEGLFAERDRPGWADEVNRLVEYVGSLGAARSLDVACGTGFLTRHLRGEVLAIDQSPSMVKIANERLSNGASRIGDALHLDVGDRYYERLFTAHFYGHLVPTERATFLAEAHRVASELIVVDAALRPGVDSEQWQPRVLKDGSQHVVFKRYFTADGLADEIGGEVVLETGWFVGARVVWE
jgi:ubiquinone/menaquinone biosynthesis C-methylase UbiE